VELCKQFVLLSTLLVLKNSDLKTVGDSLSISLALSAIWMPGLIFTQLILMRFSIFRTLT